MGTLSTHIKRTDDRWVGMALFWVAIELIVSTPGFDTFEVKLFLLLPIVVLSFLITLTKPQKYYSIWPIVMGLLVAHTGYQLVVGTITTSALEVVILVLFVIINLSKNTLPTSANSFPLPGKRFLVAFVILSIINFLVTILLGYSYSNALIESKGFIIYPLMVGIFIFTVRNTKTLVWAVIIPLLLFLVVAGRGVNEYSAGISIGTQNLRIGADYAPINLFGITLASFSLLALGWSGHYKIGRKKIGLLVIFFALMAGSFTSVSRTVWVEFAFGFLTLFIFHSKRRVWIIFLVAVLIGILIINPENITYRILQADDSSTQSRQFMFQSGWEAIKTYWITGAGWGNGQWYFEGVGVVPSGSVPWYHNDYFNLAVQVGLPGLFLYLGFWSSVIIYAAKRLRTRKESLEMAIAIGALSGLIGLFAAAGFEHVLWRPDIAGVVGWMGGILLAALKLDKERQEQK